MKLAQFFSITFCFFSAMQLFAQPSGFGYTRSYAIQLGERNLIKTPDEGTRIPMYNSGASSQLFYLVDQLRAGADISLRKNTFAFGEKSNGVLETIHAFVPVYFNLFVNSTFFLEGGGYMGVMANSGDISKTEYVSLKYWEYLNIKFDYGLITGIGIRLYKKGKLNLRYNHGLKKVVPIDRSILLENRIVELAMVFTI